MKNTKSILATNLKNLRIVRGWTQQEISELLSISMKAYAKYEEGRSEPNLATIQKLCELHDIKHWEHLALRPLKLKNTA